MATAESALQFLDGLAESYEEFDSYVDAIHNVISNEGVVDQVSMKLPHGPGLLSSIALARKKREPKILFELVYEIVTKARTTVQALSGLSLKGVTADDVLEMVLCDSSWKAEPNWYDRHLQDPVKSEDSPNM